tara:strand:- start:95598 stop:96332 length:735 start_codon:yes stop_codon:yes gene_type:complete
MFRSRVFTFFCFLSLLLFTTVGIAAPPIPYNSNFDARYKGLKAQATISVVQLDESEFIAETTIRIRLFGANISTIRETSHFDWHDDMPWPRFYEYKHTGIGARYRSASFDWHQNLAIATVDDATSELSLSGNTLDELNMYTHLKHELSQGKTEIYFNVVNRNIVEEYHYSVLGEETLSLKSGEFETVMVERVRDNSERVTQLWFAKNHDMLMLKLYQRDPDGEEFEITMRDAQINGVAVSPDKL